MLRTWFRIEDKIRRFRLRTGPVRPVGQSMTSKTIDIDIEILVKCQQKTMIKKCNCHPSYFNEGMWPLNCDSGQDFRRFGSGTYSFHILRDHVRLRNKSLQLQRSCSVRFSKWFGLWWINLRVLILKAGKSACRYNLTDSIIPIVIKIVQNHAQIKRIEFKLIFYTQAIFLDFFQKLRSMTSPKIYG